MNYPEPNGSKQAETTKLYFTLAEKLIINEFLEELDPFCSDLISEFSLQPHGLIFLKNELILNQRKQVIEFGSGLSTLFMGLIAKKYNLNTQIFSIESGFKWVSILREKIDQMQLTGIEIIHAPLAHDNENWYDKEVLDRKIRKIAPFDMVIIDGPPAFKPEIAQSRYKAIPYVLNLLANNSFILLDDANRTGERKIISRWRDEFDLDFKIYNKRFGVYWKGHYQQSNPNILNSLLTRRVSLLSTLSSDNHD